MKIPKKAIKILLVSFACFLIALVLSVAVIVRIFFWQGPVMSIKEVCKTWGSAPLDVAQFKEAGMKEDVFHSHQYHLFNKKENEDRIPPSAEPLRAKMACSLLKNQKKFYGKDTQEIRRTFGDYTGHYFAGRSPAYIIGGQKAQDPNTWQIVFLINRDSKIRKVVVHKNCCD